MEPAGWPAHVLSTWEQCFTKGSSGHEDPGLGGSSRDWQQTPPPSLHPLSRLGCLLLRDASDPGFPSFPVIGASHFQAVPGHLFPPLFLNQGGLRLGCWA